MNDTFTFGFRQVGLWNVVFDPSSQRFFYGSADVTDNLTRAQQVTVAGSALDVEAANRRASDTARDNAGLPRHSDGAAFSWWDVAGDTVGGIGDDLASAADSVREVAGVGVENAGRFKLYLSLAAIGVILFGLWKAGIFKR